MPTVFAPYIPSFSERLRSLASRCGIRSWFSFGGKTSDTVSQFKDVLHVSKSRNSIYSVSCSCGTHYVGETARNLKVRIYEHRLKSSKSTLSLHVHAANELLRLQNLPEDHEVEGMSTSVICQERNMRKRKFIESVVIKSKASKLCNVGGSVGVSGVWDPSLPMVAKRLKDMD